jgi:hypothetical protein
VKNLMQATHETIAQVCAIRSWKILLALVLVAGLAAISSSLGRQVASAHSPAAPKSASAIFTKWGTTFGTAPVLLNMEGVVSGDVGGGKFVGEVLSSTDTAGTTKIVALYHLNGGTHQFTARVHVTLDDATGVGVLKGRVTDGWLKGANVRGGFQTIAPCGIINAQNGQNGDVCFQGTLDLQQGS